MFKKKKKFSFYNVTTNFFLRTFQISITPQIKFYSRFIIERESNIPMG